MDIKEAVEVSRLYLKVADLFYEFCEKEGVKFTEGRLKFNADVKQSIEELRELAQSYLNLKGFPEEREYPGQPYSQAYETIIPEIKGYNQSLKECKLAVMKMYSKERIYQALLNWEVNIEKANILTKEERLDMLKDLAQAISQIGGEE